jgi:stage III sporulation protein AG
MELTDKIKELIKDRKWAVFMTVCGISGLLLIMISSLLPENSTKTETERVMRKSFVDTEEYCRNTEKRLGDFLEGIDGAGEVRVYIMAAGGERYVYATEGRRSRSDNKTEEEKKYVMTGSGSERKALIETVECPGITGAVVLCSGADSAAVREKVYHAAAAALDLPTAKIYVAKLK